MAPATDARSSFLDPVLLEIEGVETLSEVDYRFVRNFKNEFDPSVSWADPIVMQRFLFTPWLRGHTLRRPYTRLHASVRFLILADKTKLRSSLSPDMVSASVTFVAGESIKKMSTEEIMAQYQSKRKREDEGAAEGAAAEFAAAEAE